MQPPSDTVVRDADYMAAIKELEGEFTHLVGHVRRRYAEAAERLSPGLLPGAYKVFVTITRNSPITASDVAERMVLDKGQVSRLIKDLEERQLIERTPDPHDKRAHLLTVTEFGAQRLAGARLPTQKNLAEKLESFSAEDIARTAQLLRALYERSDEQ